MLVRLVCDERSAAWTTAAITLVGLALRLYAAWCWNLAQPDGPARLQGDEPGYDRLARAILAGHGIDWPGRVPLYPLWLAAVYAASGGSYRAVPIAQAFLGATAIPLAYLLGRRVSGHVAGLLTALGVALSCQLVLEVRPLMSEVLFTPIVLLAMLLLWDATREPAGGRVALAGALVGASALVRPTLLFFPLVVPLLFVGRESGRRAACYGAVYALAAALVVTPWIARNYVRYHAVFPLALTNALLWQGSPEYYHLVRDRGYSYMRVWTDVLYAPGSPVPDPSSLEGERYWNARAARSIAAEPLLYLRYAAEKLATYWVGDPEADWGGSHVFDFPALVLAFGVRWAALFMPGLVLPVVALAAVLLLRDQWRELLPVYALLAYCTLLHAATHAEARLSEPLQPFLLLLVAGALVQMRLTSGGNPPPPGRTPNCAIAEGSAPAHTVSIRERERPAERSSRQAHPAYAASAAVRERGEAVSHKEALRCARLPGPTATGML